jgi:hypothetical protein
MSPETTEGIAAGYSRRSFLGRVGAGAGALAAGSTFGGIFAPAARSQFAATSPTVFGRMFPDLGPANSATDRVRAALREIGALNGPLDARDALARGPVDLIVDLTLSANNANNATHTAGTTFMGQFLDHDMTFDTTSRLGVTTAPERTANARTPSLDLDSVYGNGPSGSSQLYDSRDRAKLRISSNGRFEDLPRTSSNAAIIADPRNDENLMIAGLQAAFIKFHNNAVDRVRAQNRGIDSSRAFTEARRLTTWHYHWLIVTEFLPLFVGQARVDAALRNRRFYRPRVGEAFIPVEFQGACYRFGHSMVRPSYRANLDGNADGTAFFGMIFDPAGEGQRDPVDLRGGARAARRFIGWETFFDFGDGNVRPNKTIDTNISTPLFNLPLGAIASGDPPTSLPQRNLLRGITWSLPSGQAIARRIGAPALEVGELRGYGLNLDDSTPLFYYTLKEAEVLEGGLRLGPVGGTVVAEVFVGLLQSDRNSWLNSQPSWRPTLGRNGRFTMLDFLRFAEVDPASRAGH